MAGYHLIFNPVAGSGASNETLKKAEAIFMAKGTQYSIAKSEYAGHAVELSKEALNRGYDCIVAVGGDGTVREVAGVLTGSDTPLGILPCGTGNDLVRPLKIPMDTEAAVETLLNMNVRNMDVGLANGKLFFNVAGFGFDVDVLQNTEKFKPRFTGLTAYTLALLRSLTHLKLRKVTVKTVDGEFTSNALVVEVANGTHFGGGMNVAPNADPFDGLFDVVVISDVNIWTVLTVLTKFQKGKHVGMKIVNYFNATSVEVESDPVSSLQLDGEILDVTPVKFTIKPGAIKVVAN